MKIHSILATVLAMVGTLSSAGSADLPRSSPEVQGVSSTGLLEFIEAADQQIDAMNSFMLVRHGQVVAEGWWTPYNPESKHELYSLSKSFTSTAVGLAVSEGKLSLDDEILKFFPEAAPAEPSANLKSMRVSDLLRMSTGHQDEPSSAADTVSPKTFLAQAVPFKPGTHFKYNTAATFMLSAIVQKQTGQTVLDYLGPRLFEPLGITHPVWSTNWQGISLGGYGLRVRTEDIAKFGQLYLRKGDWNGKQLVPSAWVEAATSRQTSNGSSPTSDWDQGYGYQFWRCRHGAFRGDGAFGQYCVVMPEQDAVVAITSGVKDMQAVLNLIWDKLLPAMQAGPLPSDTDGDQKLKAMLSSLALHMPEGKTSSPLAGKVAGRKYVFTKNKQNLESISLVIDPADTGVTLVSRINEHEVRTPIGFGSWIKGRGTFGNYVDEPVGASGAWISDDTLVVKLSAFETPFYATMKLHFDGNQVAREWEANVGFGSTKQPPLIGVAE